MNRVLMRIIGSVIGTETSDFLETRVPFYYEWTTVYRTFTITNIVAENHIPQIGRG